MRVLLPSAQNVDRYHQLRLPVRNHDVSHCAITSHHIRTFYSYTCYGRVLYSFIHSTISHRRPV